MNGSDSSESTRVIGWSEPSEWIDRNEWKNRSGLKDQIGRIDPKNQSDRGGTKPWLMSRWYADNGAGIVSAPFCFEADVVSRSIPSL